MRIFYFLLAVLLTFSSSSRAQSDAEKPTDHKAPVVIVPTFEADTSQVPDLEPWGRAAAAICQVWYPKIAAILKSDDAQKPLPPVVKIVFEKDMKGVAHVAGTTMHIAADWVRAHPHDFGMVAHELTHLVQRYPSYRASWLVEGIADWVRARHFEPSVPLPKINFTRAKPTDSYKTTAAFLNWIETHKSPGFVVKLHAALRAGTYEDSLFQTVTGHSRDALWQQFAAQSSLQVLATVDTTETH